MIFPNNGCCCAGCQMMQVNALKAQGGIAANEAPWLGTWTFTNGVSPSTEEIYYVESNTLQQAGRFSWPLHVPKSMCMTKRYLHWSMVGSSQYDDGTRMQPMSWHADVQWSRVHGFITSAEFYVNYDNGGDELYYSATLDEDTGEYAITDNIDAMTASGHFPYWQTANDLAGGLVGGGSGTIIITESSNEYTYVVPDTGNGQGPNNQHLLITLTDVYDLPDAVADAEDMLELIDLTNIPTGDSTETFRPLLWNLEYTVSYAAWPIQAEVLASNYVYEGFPNFCVKRPYLPTSTAVRPNFPPYVSKIFGWTVPQIEAVLWGAASGRPRRTMQVSAFPGTAQFMNSLLAGLVSTPDPSWVYVSKLRAQLNSEPAAFYSLEQFLCDCHLWSESAGVGIYGDYVCEPPSFELTGIENCSEAFNGSISDLNLSPGHAVFDYGVSILYPHCISTTEPACPAQNAIPC